jgi:basic membrane protein A and related proteins
VEKRFTPGVGVLGLAEGGLGLAPVRVDFPGKAEALEKVEAMRRAIVEGRLRPPATLAELARFVPPRP